MNSRSVGYSKKGTGGQLAASDDTIELTSRGKASDPTGSALSPIHDGSFLSLSPEIKSGALESSFQRVATVEDVPAAGQIRVTKEIRMTRV